MKSTGLALSLAVLIGTLVALDLSGAHRLHAHTARAEAQPSVTGNDPESHGTTGAQDRAAADDDVEARLVNAFLVTERDSRRAVVTPTPMNAPAAYRCVTSTGAPNGASAQYCFGTPAPLIYD